jgi:hypothetical protein
MPRWQQVANATSARDQRAAWNTGSTVTPVFLIGRDATGLKRASARRRRARPPM